MTDNAVEAMPQGGTLVVAAKVINLTQESVLPLPSGSYVQITFCDTDTGVMEKIRAGASSNRSDWHNDYSRA